MTAPPPSNASARKTPLTRYQMVLFFFLSVATFFEGYDFFVIAQVLPRIREEFGLSPWGGGALVAFINVGAVAAYFLVRKADQWGRRRVLTITILGYTVFTVLSGVAPNVWVFAGCQMIGRLFLIGEWAVAQVYAAEEFPADRRGTVIGVIQASGVMGAIVCAAIVPALLRSDLGWRGVYFIGAIPLLTVAFLRRRLRETERFQKVADKGVAPLPLLRIFRTPYRRRMLQMALIWALTYACTQNGQLFWKEFVVGERGWSDGEVGWAMSLAAMVSLPLVFASGKLLDVAGRRTGGTIIFLVTIIGVAGAYSLHHKVALTIFLVLGIFGSSAVLPVLNAFTTELFPTDLRSDAFAWANNLLGRLAGIVSPFLLGLSANHVGWGPSLTASTVFPLAALVLILARLPETSRRELEETCLVPGK
ncbi:MAG: MFS transporter [Deltaproteobacteria bacterium]|nr:MFS transporter [Deltaproteobacteria bacterium]